jgi:hypothetical protein
MLRLQLVLISTVAIAILATLFAISSFSSSIYSSNTAQSTSNSSGNNDRTKTTTINTPHGVYQTTGDIWLRVYGIQFLTKNIFLNLVLSLYTSL